MPWNLLFRLVASLLVLAGFARARRSRASGKPAFDPRRLHHTVARAREGMSLLGRVVGMATTMLVTIVTATAALTLLAPGPGWLAAVFGAIALLALAATAAEALRLRTEIRWLRHRRALELTGETLDETEVDSGTPSQSPPA